MPYSLGIINWDSFVWLLFSTVLTCFDCPTFIQTSLLLVEFMWQHLLLWSCGRPGRGKYSILKNYFWRLGKINFLWMLPDYGRRKSLKQMEDRKLLGKLLKTSDFLLCAIFDEGKLILYLLSAIRKSYSPYIFYKLRQFLQRLCSFWCKFFFIWNHGCVKFGIFEFWILYHVTGEYILLF